MQVPRRNFIKTGTLTAVGTGVALGSARLSLGAINDSGLLGMLGIKTDLTRAAFEPYIGEIFRAPNDRGRMVSLTLTQVAAYTPKNKTRITTRKPRRSESFSLTFTAPQRLPQSASIHKLRHPAFGEFDLFLTPNQTANNTLTYEAVFNRAI